MLRKIYIYTFRDREIMIYIFIHIHIHIYIYIRKAKEYFRNSFGTGSEQVRNRFGKVRYFSFRRKPTKTYKYTKKAPAMPSVIKDTK